LPRLRASTSWAIALATVIGSLSVRPALAGDHEHAQVRDLSATLARDPSFKVRASAARKLGDLAESGLRKDPAVITALRAALADRDHIVRAMAVLALKKHAAAVPDLERLAETDPSPFVRESATKAVQEINAGQATRALAGNRDRLGDRGATSTKRAATKDNTRPQRVELGRVELASKTRGTERPKPMSASGLLTAITDTIEELIEPRKPAMFPREDPDVRIDVTVYRVDEPSKRICYEARVTVVQLPGSNLRHASNARAMTDSSPRSAKAQRDLEQQVALQATKRAVSDVLALLDTK
jgi:hypothetical protein